MGNRKGRISRITRIFGMVWMVMLVFTRPAQAYLDPGTGSYIVQIVIASLLGVGFFFKTFWMSMKSVFGKFLSRFQDGGKQSDEEK